MFKISKMHRTKDIQKGKTNNRYVSEIGFSDLYIIWVLGFAILVPYPDKIIASCWISYIWLWRYLKGRL